MTREEKAKAYDEALEVLKEKFADKEVCGLDKSVLQKLFPELAESEDERIRKDIISFVEQAIDSGYGIISKERKEKWITWLEKQGRLMKALQISNARIGELIEKNYYLKEQLEKQGKNNMGISEATKQKLEDSLNKALEKETPESWNKFLDEQKSADKDEPKFKVGDWVIDKQGLVHQIANVIENVTYHTYGYDIVGGGYFNDNTEGVRLWTIQDAKDGDVLAFNDGHGNDSIELIKSITDKKIEFWFCLTNSNRYEVFDGITPYTNIVSREDATPATKEQRDLLFQKMHEAGYEWDSENKKLKGEEVDNIHNYLYGKQNLAWSEEDEARFKSCIKILQPSDGYDTINTKWLKSLKERVQSQDIAYYNPYKEVVESIAEMCKHYDKTSHSGLRDFYDNVKVKCKDAKEYDSLFPQSTWKPSDEQIGVIEAVINNRSFQRRHLDSLYADLKRLREE